MVSDGKDGKEERPARKPLSPEQRRRVQEMFDKGEKSKQRDHDYAIQMFAQCVAADPGNHVYLVAFIETVQKKYNNNKKGGNFLAAMKVSGSRGTLKKSLAKEDFPTAIRAGLELLRVNPWDIPVLIAMADASAALKCYETEQYYLKQVLDAASDKGDVELNRRFAEGLARAGRFDQATACWERVKKLHPDNEEANQAIAALHTEKIGWAGSGKNEAKDAAKRASADIKGTTREDELRQRHSEDPSDVGCANELAELLCREERYVDAEPILEKTLQATSGDLKVREHLEDVQLRRGRHQTMIAERRAKDEPSDENKLLVQKMKKELNNLELEVFRSRSERYPGNTTWKFEFAERLRLAGRINEAIKAFQEARSDPKRGAQVNIKLGHCFEMIKQYRLALSNYVAALEGLQGPSEPRKHALYRAGCVAMDHLNDLDTAERNFTELAGLDFSFKDVSERLDKLNKDRDKG